MQQTAPQGSERELIEGSNQDVLVRQLQTHALVL